MELKTCLLFADDNEISSSDSESSVQTDSQRKDKPNVLIPQKQKSSLKMKDEEEPVNKIGVWLRTAAPEGMQRN